MVEVVCVWVKTEQEGQCFLSLFRLLGCKTPEIRVCGAPRSRSEEPFSLPAMDTRSGNRYEGIPAVCRIVELLAGIYHRSYTKLLKKLPPNYFPTRSPFKGTSHI